MTARNHTQNYTTLTDATHHCANAKQKGPAVCTGMPGLSKRAVENIVLAGLRSALMTEEAMAQFGHDYTRHLAEQNKGASDRIGCRTGMLSRLVV